MFENAKELSVLPLLQMTELELIQMLISNGMRMMRTSKGANKLPRKNVTMPANSKDQPNE